MPISRIKEFLDEHQVKYVSIAHSPAYTAQEIAASAHITGKEVAKTVIVKLDGEMGMAVLRATDQVDLDLLRAVAGAEHAELAPEEEFKGRFPECDPGAMPPFGNLYNMKVFVDESLTEDEQIAFNGGTHTELLRLTYRDFDRLVSPTTAKFSR